MGDGVGGVQGQHPTGTEPWRTLARVHARVGVWKEGGRQCMCWQRLGLVASPPSLGWQRTGGALKTSERKLSIADSGRRDSVLGRHCCVGWRNSQPGVQASGPPPEGAHVYHCRIGMAVRQGEHSGCLWGQQCRARSGRGSEQRGGRGPERRKAGFERRGGANETEREQEAGDWRSGTVRTKQVGYLWLG